MILSVIIPAYNEINTIQELLNRVNAVDIEKEIIVVDDGSTDGSGELLEKLHLELRNFKLVRNEKNRGKGNAIKKGLDEAIGDMVIIQDADLECDPKDYIKLVEPIKDGSAQAVYGVRDFSAIKKWRLVYVFGVKFLSALANILYGMNIHDEAVCYKVFKTEVIKNLNLKCERFEFCPEVTAKLGKKKYKIIEVPISYNPRDYSAGKKIRIKDGLEAIWTLIKYRFID